jgi:hypothetical protein
MKGDLRKRVGSYGEGGDIMNNTTYYVTGSS